MGYNVCNFYVSWSGRPSVGSSVIFAGNKLFVIGGIDPTNDTSTQQIASSKGAQILKSEIDVIGKTNQETLGMSFGRSF